MVILGHSCGSFQDLLITPASSSARDGSDDLLAVFLMTDLGDAIGDILEFIFRLIFRVLVCLGVLVSAIFSPSVRQSLRKRWNTSAWERSSMVVEVFLSVVCFCFVIWLWRLASGGPEVAEKPAEIKIEMAQTAPEQSPETSEGKKEVVKKLIGVAGDYLKRKNQERKEAGEDTAE